MGKPSVKKGWTIIDTRTTDGGLMDGETQILWSRDGEVKITAIEGEWEYESVVAAYGQPL